jgi:hypothetical protein
MVGRKLPNGTHVVLWGLKSNAHNGLFGIVEGVSDGRVEVKMFDSGNVLRVRPECIIFPDGIRPNVPEAENNPPITPDVPEELKTAESLIHKAHRSAGNASILKTLIKDAKTELANVVKKGGDKLPIHTQKRANFMLADVYRFENNCEGIIRTVGKYFPYDTSVGESDSAWNDYPSMGVSVFLALQNLAAALGMSGNERGERQLLIHAVERFRSAPAPRPPLMTMLVDIASAVEHQVGPADSITWFRQAIAEEQTCFFCRYRLGKALLKLGRNEEALEEFHGAIKKTIPCTRGSYGVGTAPCL